MSALKKIQKAPSVIKNILTVDENCKRLCEYFIVNRKVATDQRIILIQATEDPFYLALFGTIAQSIQSRYFVHIEYYLLRSLNQGESNSSASWVQARFFDNMLLNKKWRRIYKTFCDEEAFSGVGFNFLQDIADYMLAKKYHRSLVSREELVELKIEGILVGDLIYDSYLRFKPAHTVDVKNKYVLVLIWETLRLLRRAKNYFRKKKPLVYLTSYTTYLQHGIPTRVALANNIKVLSFGNVQELYKTLSLEDTFNTNYTDNYKRDFESLPLQSEKLAEAEAALLMRLGGGIDAATVYMKNSAYKETITDIPDVHGHAIIFLHDFYDSPHVYADVVFPDFWDWVCFTIDTLSRQKIPFAIKPHPNQITLSDAALTLLIERYPQMMVLDTKITNKQLVSAGMVCAITVYGTIGHEMAFMGVPVITCAHHPHNSFSFCCNAKTKDEYAELLAKIQSLPFDKEEMRKQSLAFYYMHNLNKTDDEREIMSIINSVRFKGGDIGINMLDSMLRLQEIPAFLELVKKSFKYR